MRKRSSVLLFATVFLFVSAAYAGAETTEKFTDRLFRRLNIAEAQAEQLVKIYRDLGMGTRELRADLKVQKAELSKALMVKKASREEYEKILRRIADLEVPLQLARIDAELRTREIIGDEKWVQLRRAMRMFLQEKAKPRGRLTWPIQGR